MRLRLAGCTAWVKRWSEAMDFLQTIFKTNIVLLRILNRSKVPPLMRLGLVCYTYWVKRWSEAMDFFPRQIFYGPYQRKHLSWSKV